MTKNFRELTEKERRGIRKLVTDRCANYHEDYGCLPLDCNCVMLEKVYCGNAMCRYFRESVLPNDPEYGCLPLDCNCVMLEKVYCGNAMCRYFRESVLPNDPELSASLQNLAAKRCKHCVKPFPAKGRTMYCSARCRKEAQKKQTAKRVQKHRRNKGTP